jgi:hypothetical protein
VSKRPPEMIDPDMSGNGVHPRQDCRSSTVGVSRLVHTKPRFLQQIVSLAAARSLEGEESVQLRTKAMNEAAGGCKIAPLVFEQKRLKFGFRVHVRRANPIITLAPKRICVPLGAICAGTDRRAAPAVRRASERSRRR